MVEEKMSDRQSCVVESGHGLFPFGKVINCDDDVMMPSGGCKFSLLEINGPFTIGANCNDKVKGGHWCSHFRGKYLKVGTTHDSQDAIMK